MQSPGSPFPKPRGFALVVTVSLLVLLVLLATGLLSLSAISLRAGAGDAAEAEARANARLALALALGELQKLAGPDTRVTARADILEEGNPPVLGVWRSWEGSNHDSRGRPISPGNYSAAKERRFLGWLTSRPGEELPDTSAGAGRILLVGPGSLGAEADEGARIHLEPGELSGPGGRGAFAWWVAGENLKARLPQPYEPLSDDPAGWSVMAKSHAVADPAVFAMESLLDDPTPAERALSLRQADFLVEGGAEVAAGYFHDLSAHSVGLLTNTATGGWRKDLSLLTENWNFLPGARLPLFRVAEGRDIDFSRPTPGNHRPNQSLLYPWAPYRANPASQPIYQHGAVSSWENLKDFATSYKRITGSGNGRLRMPLHVVGGNSSTTSFDFLHRVRNVPVIARIQWVFSHLSRRVPGVTSGDTHETLLLVTPVVTMWNPYNVEITCEPLRFHLSRCLPSALEYTVGDKPRSPFRCLFEGTGGGLAYPSMDPVGSLVFQMAPGASFTLRPGETQVFSPSGEPLPPGNPLTLARGYRPRAGHLFVVRNAAGQPLRAPGDARVRVEARFDSTYLDIALGVGIYLDMLPTGDLNRRFLAYRMSYDRDVAQAVYPPIPSSAIQQVSLAEVEGMPRPFLSTVFGARMASDSHMASRGVTQSSPFVNYTAMGHKAQVEADIGRMYAGVRHPVNSPFDYSFITHAPNDSRLPNSSDATGRGYIVTGFDKSSGLSRCVISELPTRPLHSLAELQHWDLRGENPIPPFHFNLIGNSDASPLLPPNAVVHSSDAALATNLQHDDSYCANHLLFDDWFLSSIAPEPTHFGSIGRRMRDTYGDFLTGERPLANRAYRPIAADRELARRDPAEIDRLFGREASQPMAWRTIASRLEVEGMFNVNSTSVTAWRALLGHARNQRVPHLAENGAGWSIELSEPQDHPLSRFAVAGDVRSDEFGTAGAFPEAAEFAGYRVLDEAALDFLAEEIVRQVRARGPFLSLAEFVNRQLSSGDLALAGAVQAALNALAERPDGPYATLRQLSVETGQQPPGAAQVSGYRFPAAAAGHSAYGLPGWPRQADVLRPLLPVLAARDDTFTIRASGEAHDREGRVIARATCEAVVRRTREYVDPADLAELTSAPTRPANRMFGRRIEVVSFRWLHPSEI